MLGFLASIWAGATIKRLWPYGILFLAGMSSISMALDVFIVTPDRRALHRALGEYVPPEFTLGQLIANFFVVFFVYAIPFFVTWYVTKLIRSRRARTQIETEEGNFPCD